MAGMAAGTRETVFDPGQRLPTATLARFVALAGAIPDAVAPLLADDDTTSPDLAALAATWWRIDLDQAVALGARLDAVRDIDGFSVRLDRLWAQAVPVRATLTAAPRKSLRWSWEVVKGALLDRCEWCVWLRHPASGRRSAVSANSGSVARPDHRWRPPRRG